MPQRDDELIKSLGLQRLYMRLQVQLIKDLMSCMRARASQRTLPNNYTTQYSLLSFDN